MGSRLIDIAQALYDPEEHEMRTFHCTFILHGSKILSIGTNKAQTNPANLFNPKITRKGGRIFDKGMCSELVAIKKLFGKTQKPTDKLILANIRINKAGIIDNAAPCSSCRNLLTYYPFKRILFTNSQGKFQKIKKL